MLKCYSYNFLYVNYKLGHVFQLAVTSSVHSWPRAVEKCISWEWPVKWVTVIQASIFTTQKAKWWTKRQSADPRSHGTRPGRRGGSVPGRERGPSAPLSSRRSARATMEAKCNTDSTAHRGGPCSLRCSSPRRTSLENAFLNSLSAAPPASLIWPTLSLVRASVALCQATHIWP